VTSTTRPTCTPPGGTTITPAASAVYSGNSNITSVTGAAGNTWTRSYDQLSDLVELDLLTLGTFTGPAGTFRQTAELTKTQRDLLAKLRIALPKKIIEATPASP
jgi:YD repeat-containing protein